MVFFLRGPSVTNVSTPLSRSRPHLLVVDPTRNQKDQVLCTGWEKGENVSQTNPNVPSYVGLIGKYLYLCVIWRSLRCSYSIRSFYSLLRKSTQLGFTVVNVLVILFGLEIDYLFVWYPPSGRGTFYSDFRFLSPLLLSPRILLNDVRRNVGSSVPIIVLNSPVVVFTTNPREMKDSSIITRQRILPWGCSRIILVGDSRLNQC